MGNQIGRIAMREEGNMWKAYYALNDTMEGAIPLGSIHMGAVLNNEERKGAFMQLIMSAVSEILMDETGNKVKWGKPIKAPNHERNNNAEHN